MNISPSSLLSLSTLNVFKSCFQITGVMLKFHSPLACEFTSDYLILGTKHSEAKLIKCTSKLPLAI